MRLRVLLLYIGNAIITMTFKDLKKRINSSNQQQTQSFDKLHNKPFWIWNIEERKRKKLVIDYHCTMETMQLYFLSFREAIDGLTKLFIKIFTHFTSKSRF